LDLRNISFREDALHDNKLLMIKINNNKLEES